MSDALPPLRKVFVLGTHHTYQYGVGCTQEKESAFRHLVRSAAQTLELGALAEELNEDGLSEHNVRRSVLQQEAAALGLPHCFCEPSRDERVALGVQQENDLRVQAWMNGWSETDIQRRMLDEFRKRETVWCDRLLKLDAWPVLMVCGANHVPSFSALLAERDMVGEVLERCWEATP